MRRDEERKKITLKIKQYKGRMEMTTFLDTGILKSQFLAKPP